MKNVEPLRGHGAFDALFAGGQRAQGMLLRCLYRLNEAPQRGLRVGYAVPRRIGCAVRRNRVRRLMREAFRECGGELGSLAATSGPGITMVFVFRGGAAHPPERVRYADIRNDVAHMVRSVMAFAARTPQ